MELRSAVFPQSLFLILRSWSVVSTQKETPLTQPLARNSPHKEELDHEKNIGKIFDPIDRTNVNQGE